MVFSSALFLFLFFPIFFCIYYFTREEYRNIIILLGSIVFYIWGAPNFFVFLFVSLIIDWHLANLISRNNDTNKKISIFFLLVSLFLNIGLLIYFKYTNFLFHNINSALYRLHFNSIKWKDVALPIGISFIVFHKISYVVDVYKRKENATKNISTYIIYILLFPMSIAGPIIRYHNISKQLINRKVQYEDIFQGLYKFSIGLFKKVWISDNVAIVANNVFTMQTSQLSFWSSWIGAICYAFQIYFDFSGYSDMAIGLSRMMGFRISENFNHPYISQNITEFWRRWHISLSTWMKEYIYIPLGGNRCTNVRNYLNLWVVFLVSGFWHGANWTFIVWGIIHGVFIVFDRAFWLNISKRLPKLLNIMLTFFIVLIAWVFFREDSLTGAFYFIKAMFNFYKILDFSILRTVYFSNEVIFIIIIAVLASVIPAFSLFNKMQTKYRELLDSEYYKCFVTLIVLVISISRCVTSTFSPFIYFRF